MNENEFRTALRGVMMVAEQPSQMDTARVVDAARQTRKRRQNLLAGTGVVAAVAAVATTAVMLPLQDSGRPGIAPGAGPTQSSTATPTDKQTDPSWPNGQTDRTAGPNVAEYQIGAALLDRLADARPDGYDAPTTLRSKPDGSGHSYPLRSHQAQFADQVDGREVWEYLAMQPITKDGKAGRLLAEVHTPDSRLPADSCELAQAFWGMGGECRVVDIDGKQVGVVTRASDGAQFDQWAAYRHGDGTVVYIGQVRKLEESSKPALDEQPFTVRELARLATGERFLPQK